MKGNKRKKKGLNTTDRRSKRQRRSNSCNKIASSKQLLSKSFSIKTHESSLQQRHPVISLKSSDESNSSSEHRKYSPDLSAPSKINNYVPNSFGLGLDGMGRVWDGGACVKLQYNYLFVHLSQKIP